MNKVFMIGKFNSVFQEINNYLVTAFNVQVCIADYEMVKGMLKINNPNVAVISLAGLSRDDSRIFEELKVNYSAIPVVCIGSEEERDYFSTYFESNQFRMVPRPINNDRLANVINDLLCYGLASRAGVVQVETVKKKTVMLVDDSAIQLRTLQEILRGKYEVQMATTGQKAISMIEKKVPDIIFLDYEMPEFDGRMTLEKIRELDTAKNVPVVFLTGVRDREHIKAVLDLHPAAYLLKPANTETIFDTLDTILGK